MMKKTSNKNRQSTNNMTHHFQQINNRQFVKTDYMFPLIKSILKASKGPTTDADSSFSRYF